MNETYYSHYFRGFEDIPIPDDQEEAYIAQDVLSSVDGDWEERLECLKNLHLLVKKYPKVSDLWALLVIAYRTLGRKDRFRKLLYKGLIRFPKNRTLLLLAYLEGVKPSPMVLSFPLETLSDVYIWGLILMFRSLCEGDLKKAGSLYGEMIENVESDHEISHWALIQGAFALSIFKSENIN
jgi:tetratricopeptide (TPR) repeat protein